MNYLTGREGDWMWMHGKYDLDDNLWRENRPNNKSRNSDDCVVMVLRSNEVYWEDHRYGDTGDVNKWCHLIFSNLRPP